MDALPFFQLGNNGDKCRYSSLFFSHSLLFLLTHTDAVTEVKETSLHEKSQNIPEAFTLISVGLVKNKWVVCSFWTEEPHLSHNHRIVLLSEEKPDVCMSFAEVVEGFLFYEESNWQYDGSSSAPATRNCCRNRHEPVCEVGLWVCCACCHWGTCSDVWVLRRKHSPLLVKNLSCGFKWN